MKLVDRPKKILCEIDFTIVSETGDRLTGFGIDGNEAPAAIDEDTALTAIAPRCHSAVDKTGAIWGLSRFVRMGIVIPDSFARGGIQGDDAVVRSTKVKDVVDHDRRCLEHTGRRSVLRLLFRFPLPGNPQLRHVRSVDCRQR